MIGRASRSPGRAQAIDRGPIALVRFLAVSDASTPGVSPAVSLTLPRERRLLSRRDFLRIQQSGGPRVSTTHFLLALGANPDPAAPSRLGVTVSKQVSKKAVERGRCKRLVREAFRLDPGLLPPGVDLVVIVRAGAQEMGLASVVAEWASVRSLLGRRAAGLQRGRSR